MGYLRDQFSDHYYSLFTSMIWIMGLRVSFPNLQITQSLEVRWMAEWVVIRFRKVLILAKIGQRLADGI